MLRRDLHVVPAVLGLSLIGILALELLLEAPVQQAAADGTFHMLARPKCVGTRAFEERMILSLLLLRMPLLAAVHLRQQLLLFLRHQVREFRVHLRFGSVRVLESFMLAGFEDWLVHYVAESSRSTQD